MATLSTDRIRVSEWAQKFLAVGLNLDLVQSWWLELDFDTWVLRSRTSPDAIEELQRCFGNALPAVAERFLLSSCQSFQIPFGLVVGRPAGRADRGLS